MIQLSKSSCRSLTLAVLSLALAVPTFAGTALADAAAAGDTQAPPTAAEGGGGHFAHEGARVNIAGDVARYVVGPLGHVRAFVLKDGTAVLLHGTSGDAMAKEVPVGQSVRVEGWSPTSSGGKAVMHAAVYSQHGQVVTPPARGADRAERKEERGELRAEVQRLPEASAKGTVEAVIPGHHGKALAVVLNDGTSVFLRHSLAKAVAARGIRVGDQIQTTGKGASYPLGASVLAGSITFADGTRFEARPASETPAR